MVARPIDAAPFSYVLLLHSIIACCIICYGASENITSSSDSEHLSSLVEQTASGLHGENLPAAFFAELYGSNATAAQHPQLGRLVTAAWTGNAGAAPLAPSALIQAVAELLKALSLKEAALQRLHQLLRLHLASGHVASGLPGVRRTIMGAILWHRLQTGPTGWSKAIRILIAELCADLVALHVAAAKEKVCANNRRKSVKKHEANHICDRHACCNAFLLHHASDPQS